jgi:hypothetical protein
MPTAHPTMIPILELDFVAGEDGKPLLTFSLVGVADGVVITVSTRVTTPEVPKETLVFNEVTGVILVTDDTAGLDKAALAVADEGAADDEGAGVFEA